MKNLLLIFTVLFSSVFFSSPSYAEWEKVTENSIRNTYYVDFERIRKHDGFVYWWTLGDFPRVMNGGLSAKLYNQGDCKLFRYKYLRKSFHEEPMGGGTGDTVPVPESFKDWKYPPPNSIYGIILKAVCSR